VLTELDSVKKADTVLKFRLKPYILCHLTVSQKYNWHLDVYLESDSSDSDLNDDAHQQMLTSLINWQTQKTDNDDVIYTGSDWPFIIEQTFLCNFLKYHTHFIHTDHVITSKPHATSSLWMWFFKTERKEQKSESSFSFQHLKQDLIILLSITQTKSSCLSHLKESSDYRLTRLFISIHHCQQHHLHQSTEHIIITSYSRTSTRSSSSEGQNFDTLTAALAYIKLLSLQDQYSLLEYLNTTLNWLQAGILDVQSNIVNYVQQEKLWQCYIDERTFLSAWNDTLEKIRKHWSQQNKIKTVITTIQQYWDDSVWERYLNNLRITYTEVDEIWKLIKSAETEA
jgi:hypothetical protein